MSENKKVPALCKSCQWWQSGEFSTTSGRVKIRSCRMPISDFHMQITGAHGTCDKYAYTREGVHDGA